MTLDAVGMGYMGFFKLDGVYFPATNLDFKIRTEVRYYDHTIGLVDSVPSTWLDSKGVNLGSAAKTQKYLYRFAPVLPTASVSGMIHDVASLSTMLSKCLNFDLMSVAELGFKQGDGVKMTDAYISRLSFNVSAGDILSYSMDLVSFDYDTITSTSTSDTISCGKLLTWDQITVASAATDNNSVATISVDIDNNVQPIYTTGLTTLLPRDIRAGIQAVSGSLGVYSPDFVTDEGTQDTISIFSAGSFNLSIKVVYEPGAAAVDPGPFIVNIPFKSAAQGVAWTSL